MSDLLHELGLDPDNFEWQDLALCQHMPTSWFYDEYESDVQVARQVDSACLTCPVLRECMEAGQSGEYGVWGGIYWNGAGKPDKNRNSHKTEETWAAIKHRMTE